MSLLTQPSAASDALVLRTWSCGETSTIASLLTRDHGYVKVLAKAARRPRSRLRALVEPGRLVNLEFGLDPARDLQYLRGGSVLLDPLAAGATLERSAYLQGALELADRCRLQAGDRDAEQPAGLFAVCEDFVRVLSSPTCGDPALLFFGFEWDLLDRHGMAPELATCVACAAAADPRPEAVCWFSPAEGGLVCDACLREGRAPGARPLGPEARERLRALGAHQRGTAGELPRAVRRELGAHLHHFLGFHLPGYRLPGSLDLLRAGKEPRP